MKNKIQYVRIVDGGGFQSWYRDYVGYVFPVVLNHSENLHEDLYEVFNTDLFIIAQDCQPVKIKELDKDIDGNYLECGDKVIAEGETYTYGGLYPLSNTWKYLVLSKTESMNKHYLFREVRKIKKGEKKEMEKYVCLACGYIQDCGQHRCNWCADKHSLARIENYTAQQKGKKELSDDFEKFAKELKQDKEKCIKFLQHAGIYDKNNQLTEDYIEDVSGEPPQSGYFEEEKKVDPMQEYIDDLESLVKKTGTELHFVAIEKIKQHMEDKNK